jgi:hypothetical protein
MKIMSMNNFNISFNRNSDYKWSEENSEKGLILECNIIIYFEREGH